MIVPENDNYPVFELDGYIFNVSENVPGRFAIGAVRAIDDDVDTISYLLQPSSIRGKSVYKP